MQKKTRFFLSLLVLLLLGLAVAGLGRTVLAAGKIKLEVHEDTSYVVSNQDDVISVHTRLVIINRDPKTRKKSRGRYYFYNSIYWELPKGVTHIQAKRGNGRKLKVMLKKKGKQYDLYEIFFRRKLFYKQKMTIDLRYTISDVQPPFYLSDNVMSLPGYVIEDKTFVSEGTFSIEFPGDLDVTADTDLCTVKVGGESELVSCKQGVSSQRVVGEPLAFEASRDTDEQELVSEPIPMQEQDITIRVRYAEGEEEWAQKVVSVLSKALPVLEDVMGFPYQGSGEIEVVRSATSETGGYEGWYEDADTVRIHPSASVATIVHEGAHLWSWPFKDTWLTEGWAEWSAREAMRRLKMDPGEQPFVMPRKDTVKMPLQDWEHMGLDTDEAEEIEGYGYAKSYDTMQRLVKLVGLKQLQQANQAFAESSADDYDKVADSYAYLEKLLEQTRSKRKATRLRKLWRSRVLNEEGKEFLKRRDAAWKEAVALRKRAEALGWEMPQSLQDDLTYRHFYSFRTDLRSAGEVLDAWEEALPLFEKLGWQPDALVQRRFETESDWDRTVRAAEHRLRLTQQALEVQEKIESGQLGRKKATQARKLLKEAGQALEGGNIYKADKLVAQARKLLGLSD